MNEVVLLIVTAVIALLAAIIKVRKKQPVPDLSNPPKNQVADVARNSAAKEFQDNLQAIEKDLSSDTPADDLAGRGNARSRR